MKMVVPSVIDHLIADDIHSLLKVKATNKKVQRCVIFAQKVLSPSMSILHFLALHSSVTLFSTETQCHLYLCVKFTIDLQ